MLHILQQRKKNSSKGLNGIWDILEDENKMKKKTAYDKTVYPAHRLEEIE